MISKSSLLNVVPIGMRGAAGMGSPLSTMWIGSGFIVRSVSGDSTNYFLITNKHVVQGNHEISIRLPISSDGLTFRDVIIPLFDAGGAMLYTAHPNQFVDIVAISINANHVGYAELGFEMTKEALTLSQMKTSNIGEGDLIYALGFPMGMVDMRHSYPICRMGCISRISSSYDGMNPIDYIVDAQTFPGNSGGPIVAKVPSASGDAVSLVGILLAYIPYQEALFSQQTRRQRSTMEENSGLTVVHPVDRIQDVIKLESSRVELAMITKSPTL